MANEKGEASVNQQWLGENQWELLLYPNSGSIKLGKTIIGHHTILVGLKYLLPEDVAWRRENPRVPAMICLSEERVCTCPHQCMMKLARRCDWLFNKFPTVQQILVLFKREEKALQRQYKTDFYLKDNNEQRYAYNHEGVGNKQVLESTPRIWAFRVSKEFDLGVMRTNYYSLQLILGNSSRVVVDTPTF